MKILIKNISSSTTDRVLREFAEQVISPRWYAPFAVKGKVTYCVVQTITDLDTGEVEFQGLVDITPFKAAQTAINNMSRQKLNGRSIEARKWHIRSHQADRRDKLKSDGRTFPNDRRIKDRRRPNLVMETYEPLRYEGLKGFHREYGNL